MEGYGLTRGRSAGVDEVVQSEHLVDGFEKSLFATTGRMSPSFKVAGAGLADTLKMVSVGRNTGGLCDKVPPRAGSLLPCRLIVCSKTTIVSYGIIPQLLYSGSIVQSCPDQA